MPLLARFKFVSDFLESSNIVTFPFVAYCYSQLWEECECIPLDLRRNGAKKQRELLKEQLRVFLESKMTLSKEVYAASVIAPHLKLEFVPESEVEFVKKLLVEMMEHPDLAFTQQLASNDSSPATTRPLKRSKTANKVLAVFESQATVSSSQTETAEEELNRNLKIPVAINDLYPGKMTVLESEDVLYADILSFKS